MSEAMRFMVEVEGHFPREAICVRLLSHLQKHCESISRAPHFSPTRNIPMTSEHIVPVPSAHDPMVNKGELKVNEGSLSKVENEQNNSDNVGYVIRNNQMSLPENEYDKTHVENNNHMSYKYKTNIKLRFTQDINGGYQEPVKRQKLDSRRRNSVTSTENHR